MTENALTREEILSLAQASAAITEPCACAGRVIRGWESLPITFPEQFLDKVGMVCARSDHDLTVEEFHPDGTNYWSDTAPISLAHFPANRCEVARCRVCARCYLRYTEFGGYYVDRRIRSLQPELISEE